MRLGFDEHRRFRHAASREKAERSDHRPDEERHAPAPVRHSARAERGGQRCRDGRTGADADVDADDVDTAVQAAPSRRRPFHDEGGRAAVLRPGGEAL